MTRTLTYASPAALLAPLLLAVGLIVPSVNAHSGPPPSVFHQLDPSLPEPEIRLSARQSAAGNWTLFIDVEHFDFTPICRAVGEPKPTGHAHVINGDVKIASAFQPWIGLGRLEPGRHEIRVVLRGQDHRALMGASGLLAASIEIDVSADAAA